MTHIPTTVTRRTLLGAAATATLIRPSRAASPPGVLRIVPEADLQVMDPIQTTSNITRNHAHMIYDTLFALDTKAQPKPQMVGSYDVSADKMRYQFVLRDGLTFHDGTPVTAADCVASLKRWGNRDAIGKAMMAATGSLEAQGDRTIVLQLASPFGLVLEALGKPGGNVPVIMPARLANTPASIGITDPTGSGPYMMKKDEWNAGSKVVYTRFAGYKPRDEPADGFTGGKVAHFDRVEWIYIPDASTAINSLLTGEIDFVQFPQLDYIPGLKRNRDIKLAIPKGIAQVTGYARLNHLVAPTNDPRIRKAMQLLVDQDDVMQAVGAGDLRTPTWTFFVAGGPYATDAGTDEIRTPNPERAKQLMSEAGYKGEKVVVLHATDIAGNHLSSLVIEDAWKRAGFNVDVQNMDWSTVVARRASRAEPDKGGWNMFVAFPSGFDSHLPSTHPYIANNCDANVPGWSCDAATTPLLKAFPAEPDFAKRQAIAAQIQLRAIADVPCILWGQWAQPSAYRANLDGLLNVGVPVFWNVRRI